VGPARVVISNIVPLAADTPFSFDCDRSATRVYYVTISVANESLMTYLLFSSSFKSVSVTVLNNTDFLSPKSFVVDMHL
jgi:hypothetical protein